MLEKNIEKAHVANVTSRGGLSLKFTSPQRRSVPDRIDLLGTANAAILLSDTFALYGIEMRSADVLKLANEIVAEAIQFTELKAPGKKPTPSQEREHARLRMLGFRVNVKDSK